MLINGRVRQACTAPVDHLLAAHPLLIELRPMTKFPVIRDLLVDRSRTFACLEKILAWLPVDSYLDMGPGLRQSQETQQMAYLYSKCMTCGCCLEACPQFLKIELKHKPGETEAEYRARQRVANMRSFMGSHAIAQVELFNSNPVGAMNCLPTLGGPCGRRRHSNLRQRAKLRESVPQGHPADNSHRSRRPRRHIAYDAEVVRSVGKKLPSTSAGAKQK